MADVLHATWLPVDSHVEPGPTHIRMRDEETEGMDSGFLF